MADAERSPTKTTVNIRMTETFLADVDSTWQDLGYNSRSEYIRDVLRDAVKHPECDRADLKAIAASEVDIQQGNVHTSDEIKAEYGLNEPSEE